MGQIKLTIEFTTIQEYDFTTYSHDVKYMMRVRICENGLRKVKFENYIEFQEAYTWVRSNLLEDGEYASFSEDVFETTDRKIIALCLMKWG